MKKAFTLIELLVAIGIFSIVVAIGIGGFVHALRTQREVAALIATQSNVSVALEQMAREIRTGDLFCTTPPNNDDSGNPGSALPYICTPNAIAGPQGVTTGCTQSGGNDNDPIWTCNDIIDFYNADGYEVDYEWVNGALERTQSGPSGLTPITGSGVNVSNLTFTIFGNTEGDNWPPRITISISAAPVSSDPTLESDVINLQTTVSAREIDCTSNGSSESC